MQRRGTMTRQVLAISTILLGLHGGTAAAEVTPEQKASLETLLRSWYSAGGKALAASADAARVVAAGDHFDVSAPIRLTGTVRGDVRLTARALPRDAGRWRFEEVRAATPFTFTADVPAPPKDGEKASGRTVPMTYTASIAEQNSSADYDPTFRSPLRYESGFKGLALDATGEGMTQRTRVESGTGNTVVTPAAADAARLDAESKGELTGYNLVTRMGEKAGDIGIDVRRIAFAGELHGLDKAQFGKLTDALAAVGALPGVAKSKALPPALRDQLVAAMRGLLTDVVLAEDFEQLKVSVGGLVFAFDKGRIGFGGASKDGLVRTATEFGYDGLVMPNMGMGFEELVPRRLVVKPYLADVPAEGLAQVFATATAGKDPAPGDFAPLFRRGPVVAGVETLTLDIAGTVFTGEGSYTMTSPAAGTGKARIVAENLDSLIQKLNGQPMAQQAVPAIVFMKGIGKSEGGKLVWEVNYAGGKVLVNGLDMTAMAGGAPKGPPPRR